VTEVLFYLDFVSPYTYLALTQARRFERDHGVRFDVRPVVYAKLLDAARLVGPAESESKRRYTFTDVLRVAHRLDVPLTGPPAHPFRSLEALRALQVFRSHERALDLAVALSSAAWAHGRDLTDVAVIADVVAATGFDSLDLAVRLGMAGVKQALADATAAAIDAGVFGVPTFVAGGEMFWGQDRMADLGAFVDGRLPAASERADRLLSRPRGADRRILRPPWS
jgi:2-hydroxychromene-2-carboxylate isomerase